MLNTPIENLLIVPEEYDLPHYEKADYSHANSLMSDIERRFINGLIRYYNPKNLIEIGVYTGGGNKYT